MSTTEETPRVCPCGRPTVTAYHEHCAVCIRTAKPCTASHAELFLQL